MEKERPKIVVVGSSNMDLVVTSARIPAVGETILGEDFIMTPGGKGANQAVAAAKLGADVHLVAELGRDVFAEQSLNNFRTEGVNTEYITQTEEAPSGVALITVDRSGDNVIVVASGANRKLSPQDVEKARAVILSADAVAVQLEVPLETVEATARLAKSAGVPFILDPAPAQKLSPELLRMVDVLTPNETEAAMLTGIEVTSKDTAERVAWKLLECGVQAVIVTMGAKGFLLATGDSAEFGPAVKVDAVDTTAAGDAFTGALAVGVGQGKALSDAAQFANYAAALSVTRMGAQASMPTRQEVECLMKKRSNREVNDENV